MPVTHIRFSSAPSRPKYNPKVGDLRILRGKLYIREYRRSQGMVMCSNGRLLYKWVEVSPENLEKEMARYEREFKK